MSEGAVTAEELRYRKGWRRYAYSTNHKDIGTMYILLAAVMGLVGAAMSILFRAELQVPGLQILSDGHFFNVLITAHGLIMVFFMVMPAMIGRHGELDGAADDRLTGHGLPPDEQPQLLALGRRRLLPRRLRLRARRAGRWGRRRLDDLPALEFRGRTRRARRRHGDLQPGIWRARLRSSAPSTSSRRFSTCARPA